MPETARAETLPEPPAPDAGPAVPRRRRAPSVAIVGLFVLAVLYTLHFASPIVLPIVLAVVLSLMLSPLVRWLGAIGLPRVVGAALVVLALVSALAGGAYLIAEPAAEWAGNAMVRIRDVEHRLRGLKESMEKVTAATDEIQRVTSIEGPETKAAVAVRPSPLAALLDRTPAFFVALLALLALVYFLLASGDLFLRKLIGVLPRFSDKKRAVDIAHSIHDALSTYLLTMTAINAAIGTIVGITAHLVGLPTPVFWGVLAGLMKFVPYVAPIVTTTVLSIVSLLTFDTLGEAVIAPVVYLAVDTLEEFVTPQILGRRLLLNPVVIFIGLLFWGWIWGIPGAILAVPLLASFKIVCDRIESLAPVGEFMGR